MVTVEIPSYNFIVIAENLLSGETTVNRDFFDLKMLPVFLNLALRIEVQSNTKNQ